MGGKVKKGGKSNAEGAETNKYVSRV